MIRRGVTASVPDEQYPVELSSSKRMRRESLLAVMLMICPLMDPYNGLIYRKARCDWLI